MLLDRHDDCTACNAVSFTDARAPAAVSLAPPAPYVYSVATMPVIFTATVSAAESASSACDKNSHDACDVHGNSSYLVYDNNRYGCQGL